MDLMYGPLTDEIRIDELLAYGRHYCRNNSANHAQMEKRVKEAIDSAAFIGHYKGVVEGYQVLSLIKMGMGFQDMAINALKMSEAFLNKYRLPEESYLELYNTYVIYYMDFLGDSEQAADICQKAIDLAGKLGNRKMLVKLRANLGTLHILFGNFEQARGLLEKALDYYQSLNDHMRTIYCMSNLGEACLGCGDYEQAMALYTEALGMAIEAREDTIVEEAAIGLGKLHRINNENKKAVKLLEETSERLRRNSELKLGGKLLIELIDLYIFMDNYIMADLKVKEFEDYKLLGLNTEIDLRYYTLKSDVAIGFGDYKLAYLMGKNHYNLHLEASEIKGQKVLDNIVTSQLTKTIECLEKIGKIGRKLTTYKAKDNTLMFLHKELKELMLVDSIGIGILEDNRVNYSTYQSDMNELTEFQAPVAEEGFSHWCIAHKKEMMINDINAEYSMYVDDFRRKVDGRTIKLTQSALYIPLMVEDRVLGVIIAQSYKSMAYGTEDLETLKVIASYVAIAVLNNQQAKELKRLSLTDQLTGLRNRNGLANALSSLNKPRVKTISMVMLDLDHFKKVNDSYGHMVGDEVLKVIGELLRSYDDDKKVVAARLGGEEFALLAFNYSRSDVEQLTVEILDKVRQLTIDFNDKMVTITVSAGVCHYDKKDQPTMDLLYRYADRALYTAKESGRDCMRVYNPSMLEKFNSANSQESGSATL